MTPQSAKSKGRRLQQMVRDLLLKYKPTLHPDDIKSTSMGAGGEDVQLSPAARKEYPIQIECKNKENYKNVYRDYKQSGEHGKYEPVLIVKINQERPLAIVDAEFFIRELARP
jgi:hypothetical protein